MLIVLIPPLKPIQISLLQRLFVTQFKNVILVSFQLFLFDRKAPNYVSLWHLFIMEKKIELERIWNLLFPIITKVKKKKIFLKLFSFALKISVLCRLFLHSPWIGTPWSYKDIFHLLKLTNWETVPTRNSYEAKDEQVFKLGWISPDHEFKWKHFLMLLNYPSETCWTVVTLFSPTKTEYLSPEK